MFDEIELPDGTIIEVPMGSSPEQIKKLLQSFKPVIPQGPVTTPVDVSGNIVQPAVEEQKSLSISNLSEPENISIIKDSILLRQGGEGIASMARRGAGQLLGESNVQLAGTETDQELIDMWLEQNRLLNIGQSITLGNEVALVANLDDKGKDTLNKSYKLFESLGNVYTGDTTLGQKVEATKDYLSGAIWDPTNLIGLGVGKALTSGGTKAAVLALKVAVEDVAKLAAKSAASQNIKGAAATAFVKAEKDKALSAGMSVIRNNAAKKELGGAVVTDFVLEVGKDIIYQNKVQMEVNPERDYNYSQTALSGLGAIALPAVIYSAKGVSKVASLTSGKLAEKYNLKDIFASYNNASLLANKMSPEDVKAEILKKLNTPQADSSIKGAFDNFLKDRDALASWQEAKKLAEDDLRSQGITPTNTFEMDDFYRKLFRGTLDANGNPLGEGLIQALQRDGIAFKALDEDDKIANFLGDAIEYLDSDMLKTIVRDYEVSTGSKLGFNLNSSEFAKELGTRWKTNSSIGGLTNQLNSLAKRTLGEDYTAKDLVKLFNNTKPEKQKEPSYAAWALSVRNRLLTAHPSTTAVNLTGWAYMSGANTLSEIVEGSLNLAAGKVLNNVDLAVKGKGTLLGVARRGYNVLNWNATIEEGLELLENIPKAKEDLFRVMSGDVGIRDPREFHGLGDNNKVVNGIESYTRTMQKIWGVNLQDQWTKLISFVSNLDQSLMKSYDITLSEFMSNPKWQVELRTKKFVSAYEEALEKTLKETGAFSWSDKAGNTIALKAAKSIEKLSNSSTTGWVLPFGRWFNTSTAFVSDFTGASLAYNSVLKAGGVAGRLAGKGDAWEKAGGTDLVADMSKAIVFWGGISLFQNEADEKLESGTPWNIKIHDDGTREDLTNQFPRNLFSFFAQRGAHWRKDGEIPSELNKGGFESLLLSAFKGTEDTIQDLKRMGDLFYEGDLGPAILEFIGKVASSNVSAGTRGLDPVNNALLLFTDDFENPDRRQGSKFLKEAFRYVDQIVAAPDSPERQDPTKGGSGSRDISKVFSGFSSKNEVAIADRMIAAVGQENWRILKWQGDPVVKNRMDEIFSVVINGVAREKLARHRDFFNRPLGNQRNIVNSMIEEAKDITVSLFKSGVEERDRGLIALRELNNFSNKRALEKAKEILKIDDLAELIAEPGGPETLEKLLAAAKTYGDQILD
jgi:hypothetical protein